MPFIVTITTFQGIIFEGISSRLLRVLVHGWSTLPDMDVRDHGQGSNCRQYRQELSYVIINKIMV